MCISPLHGTLILTQNQIVGRGLTKVNTNTENFRDRKAAILILSAAVHLSVTVVIVVRSFIIFCYWVAYHAE